jgi:DNA polymerase (family 10)
LALNNREIADIFADIADMLEIKGESRFRYLSYRRAADTIRSLSRNLQAYADDGELEDLPGIGKSSAEKIRTLLETGTLEYYEELRAEVPPGVVEMMRINGVGPKKAKLFWDELNITGIDELKAAAEANRLQELSGMGTKSEQKILDAIQSLERRSGRTPIGKAKPVAEQILSALLALPEAIEGAIAGSIRRGRETIGDVDILIASEDATPIMQTFVEMSQVRRVLGHGETKSSVEMQSGLQVDVRVLPKARWGTALQYFTGSKAHNVKMRKVAREQGLSLNEDAFSPIDDEGNIIDDAEKIYCATEEDVYETLGLAWIPPEIREDNGEIEAARDSNLPTLITLDDIQGDLHMHTTYSDGKLSIREMAEAAKERGRTYIVITDHSQSSYQANGLEPERLLKQQDEVRQVNEDMGDDFQVLHGVELDIKSDGSLDYDDELLAKLDFVVASLHISLRQDENKTTQRLLNAIQNPHVDCIGHPTARLVGRRDPVKVDIESVIDAAAEHGTLLEINANPARLDLNAGYARLAIDRGVMLAINTDAHNAGHMDLMAYGVITARRGGVEAKHVINTRSFEAFQNWLRSRNA